MAGPNGLATETTNVSVSPRAKDLPLTFDLVLQARSQGIPLTALLEDMDTHDYHDSLDAFQRQLSIADIRVISDNDRGVPSHTVNRFYESAKPGTENLLPEYIRRVWRGAGRAAGWNSPAARYYMSSQPVSDVLYPPYIQQQMDQKQIAPVIPLSLLISQTVPMVGGAYISYRLTDDVTQRTMNRVGEGAELPVKVLTGSNTAIMPHKYGGRLQITYEAARRMQIDEFAGHLALMAVQAEVDKVATAIDVAVNGDGNASTAATNYNLTTLDTSTTALNMTLKAYLAWRAKWKNPYACNVIIAQETEYLALLLLNMGSANAPFYQFANTWGIGGFTPINQNLGAAGIGQIEMTALGHKIVGLDSRFALRQITETGSDITETDRIITRQFNEIVISESLAFAVRDQLATKTLDANA